MRIVEQTVSAGGAVFDLHEFLARPLFAHLAFAGTAGVELVRFISETVVVRDQSYRPTRWAQEREPATEPR